jgi:nucleoside-diphosphate-sugar epimerase
MRVVIIGGTGHVGTYLVPRLVELGHTVVSISRKRREPYLPHAAWTCVEQVQLDREPEEEAGAFGSRIASLRGDVVIDMICFNPRSASHLVGALSGRVQLFLHCGTMWVHGYSVQVPVTEDAPRRPFGEYGIGKAAIESYLLDEARRNRFPAAVLHPGHIVGRGWPPLNPAGHFNPRVFTDIAHGRPLTLPNFGLETVHHVHADDVAQAFIRALTCWSQAVGESFHVVSGAALTLRGYAEAMYRWFGCEPNLAFLPWEQWKKTVSEDEAAATWDHIAHSPNGSTEKARRLLGYSPRYTSLEAVQESVEWLIAHGIVKPA